MHYEKFKPCADLRPFVECYYTWENQAAEPLSVQSPPNGFSAIVFNFGAPYSASQGSDRTTEVPKAFVSGQFTSNYHLHLNGTISVIGVVLKPSAVHNFFAVRMSHLVNARAPLDLLCGNDSETLWQKMFGEPENRLQILESFLMGYLTTAKSRLSIIDEAVEFIDEASGCVTVDAVASHFGISRRYLEKKFLEKVGVSPKFYARIKRFSTLSNEIAHSSEIDWQHVVARYGFHDQSHLVKEFVEFNRMNPTQYHLLHREMIRFVKS